MDRVRPEYLKLAHGFPALAASFGCAIPAAAQRELVEFTMAMECIDRELDAEANADLRRGLAEAIVAGTVDRPRELADHVARLHVIAPPSLWDTAKRALANSERMRRTRDPRAFIACVEEEGRLTVAMMLAIVGPFCSPPLERFLRRVSELANLVDKLIDARADFARGEMALRPGVRVHARLATAILENLPGALWSHPNWPRFAMWGLSYVRAMVAMPGRSVSA